jgi:hypothetical protein
MEDFDGHSTELRLDKAGRMEAIRVWGQTEGNNFYFFMQEL